MVTVTTDSGSILKPYILRATYQWCLDFGFSPCIQAIVCPTTRVPRDYVESGMIILNISPTATHKLDLTNNDISFTGRFAGIAMEIWVPVKNVSAIFSKETGQGVTFENIPESEQESGRQSKISKNENISTSGICYSKLCRVLFFHGEVNVFSFATSSLHRRN